MADNKFSGIAGIADMERRLEAVAAQQPQQERLPHWFQDVPVDSAPGQIMLSLSHGIEGPKIDPARDPVSARRREMFYKQYNLLAAMHRGHNASIEEGIMSGSSAIEVEAEVLKTALKNDRPPYAGYGLQEFEPFIDRVVDAYVDYYEGQQSF